MNVHENARTSRHSRMLVIERLNVGWRVPAVATAMGVSAKTVRKWRAPFVAEGVQGLVDRTSRPHDSPTRIDSAAEAEIEACRRQTMTGPAIARRLRRPLSTIGAVLRRQGLGCLASIEPRPPILRYEREHPGELIHIENKELGRIDGIGQRINGNRAGQSSHRAVGKGLGCKYLHVAIDDCSRLAFTQLLATDRKEDATAFLESSLAWFKQQGVAVQHVITNNGLAWRGAWIGATNFSGLGRARSAYGVRIGIV